MNHKNNQLTKYIGLKSRPPVKKIELACTSNVTNSVIFPSSIKSSFHQRSRQPNIQVGSHSIIDTAAQIQERFTEDQILAHSEPIFTNT
jgi:hypothetical protein